MSIEELDSSTTSADISKFEGVFEPVVVDSIAKIAQDIEKDPNKDIQLTIQERLQENVELLKVLCGLYTPEKSRNYGKNFFVQVEDIEPEDGDTAAKRAIVRIRTRIANARDYRPRIIQTSQWNEKGQPEEDPTVRGPLFKAIMKVGADQLITESVQWGLYYLLNTPLTPKNLKPQKNLSLLGPRMLLKDRRIESGHEVHSPELAKYSPSIIPIVYFLRDKTRKSRPDYKEIEQVGWRERLYMRYLDIHGKPKTYAKFIPAVTWYVGKRLLQKSTQASLQLAVALKTMGAGDVVDS